MQPPKETERLSLTSADPVAARVARVRELFPDAGAEGKFDVEKLRAILGGEAAAGPERYGLSWAGKSDAIKAIQTLTTATLLPIPGESEKWDSTGNAIIEGDNLEVLKVLQHAYYGKVKLIYIDPPYNTGGDFIYPDDYAEGLGSYLRFTRQVNEEGAKLTTNVDSSGRYHSRWLTMMYPRLFLARNLLREDGVIFVSIDDHEVHNLRLIMDEIFGEENFLAEIVWKKSYGGGSKTKGVVGVHEYVIAYCRDREGAGIIELPPDPSVLKYYKFKDAKFDKRGPFRMQPLATTSMDDRPNLRYPIVWEGEEIWPDKQWQWSRERVENAILNDELVIRKRADRWSVEYKQYLRDEEGNERMAKPFSVLDGPYTQVGTDEFRSLFSEDTGFSFPKPIGLIKHLLTYGTQEDLILDFFAGSGTTAQAVLELNKEDAGNRRFILVQLPEPTGREDYPTIADITKERVRRVIKRIESERAGELPIEYDAKTDLGFKVLKLAESNFAIWDPVLAANDPEKLAEQWTLSAENVQAGAPDAALLYELMLKNGLPLDAHIETKDARGADVHSLDSPGCCRVLICVCKELTREQLRAMAEMKPQSVVCLDIAFKGNDALKVNAQLEFESHGIRFRTA